MHHHVPGGRPTGITEREGIGDRFPDVESCRGGGLSEDGQVRFDVVRTDGGGYLTINSSEGEVRFDLVRGDHGGELVVRSEKGTLRFGAGEAAEAMPGWVPRLDAMPSDPEGVYSLTSREGFLGAVTWQSDSAWPGRFAA